MNLLLQTLTAIHEFDLEGPLQYLLDMDIRRQVNGEMPHICISSLALRHRVACETCPYFNFHTYGLYVEDKYLEYSEVSLRAVLRQEQE